MKLLNENAERLYALADKAERTLGQDESACLTYAASVVASFSKKSLSAGKGDPEHARRLERAQLAIDRMGEPDRVADYF